MISTGINVDSNLARCSKNIPIAILAATNATIYSSGPPSWDSTSQTLQYRVAGPHLISNGSLNRGNYSLILNAEVAKCLYQSQSSLFQATVEVVSDQGNQITTTTSLNTSNGYLNLTAQNFTFSSPTIRIKLLPEIQAQINNMSKVQSQAGISNSSIATSSSKNGMKTIICLKGKTTKKVTSLSPACPKGYVKK